MIIFLVKYSEYFLFNNKIKGKTIGEGTFGKVKLGIHLLTNEEVNKNYFKYLYLFL